MRRVPHFAGGRVRLGVERGPSPRACLQEAVPVVTVRAAAPELL